LDIYHVWCDLKSGVSDTTFAENVATYLDHLKQQGLIEQWRLTRRKLGLGAPGLGEFHLMLEVKNLAQLEQAFERVASRRDPVEGFHFGVNSLVQNAVFALYRDVPDTFRHRGEERF
jgi:hypothetical protein